MVFSVTVFNFTYVIYNSDLNTLTTNLINKFSYFDHLPSLHTMIMNFKGNLNISNIRIPVFDNNILDRIIYRLERDGYFIDKVNSIDISNYTKKSYAIIHLAYEPLFMIFLQNKPIFALVLLVVLCSLYNGIFSLFVNANYKTRVNI